MTTQDKKIYCAEVDCKGAPGCDCRNSGRVCFKDFIASRKEVSNIGEALNDLEISDSSGFVYLNGFYIERSGDLYHLMIGNEETLDECLEVLEKKLWDDFACLEANSINRQ